MTTDMDNAATVIADLARASTKPAPLELGEFYTLVTEHGVEKIDLTGDQYRDAPKRKTGTITVRNVASFAQYWGKHASDWSEVYADYDAATFTAVIDAHQGAGEDAGWRNHKLILGLEKTLPWQRWLSKNTQMMPQQEFAEFLEDNACDVAADGPVSVADLLEVAQSFQAKTEVEFASGSRLPSGETRLVYSETVQAQAGQRGEVVIPTEFLLGIAPYEDCDVAYRILARFRYRINSGHLTLGYFLDDPQRKARIAVEAISDRLADQIRTPIMVGRPA